MDEVAILIVDAQNDFHEGGSLAVSGATADSARIAEFMKAKEKQISMVYVTLDSHHKEHIAHGVFWSSTEDGQGKEPEFFSQVSHQDLLDGKWFPKDKTLKDYCIDYCRQLEEKGRFKLTIWPQHCIIGSAGQDIVECIQDAIDSWEKASGKKAMHIYKGMNNLTEMYSAIEAEVPLAADIHTRTNEEFLAKLKNSRKLYICGQALSHCVNYTARDILKYWAPRESKDIIILRDGSSPVYGCQEAADQFLADMTAAGCTIKTVAEAMSDF